jgi:hypothetical protein|tara:strand:+ start:3836 stop:4837 length:1002 start_codon:yes stop_codon:yes gene_type:complete
MISKNNKNILYYWDGPISSERKKILDDALYSSRFFNRDRPIYLITNSIEQNMFHEKYDIEVVKWDNSIYSPIETLDNIDTIKNTYNAAHPRERSDLFRLLMLYKYGGTYVDTDDISFRSIPSAEELTNSFCSSYDPHTCHYNKLGPDDCIPGRHREVRGYDHIPIFPRNDCLVNFEPEHFMIGEMLHDKRFTSRVDAVYIGDEFSWQRLTLEVIKKNLGDIQKTFNMTLNLLYLYESHVGVASYWDRCLHGGPICDVWPIKKDHPEWDKYRTNKEEALETFEKMSEVYTKSSFLWMHDKCGNAEWQIQDLDPNKKYLISTYVIDAVRSRYRSL